jgi:hypothetical protein
VRNARRVQAGIFGVARNTREADVAEYRHDVGLLDLSATGAKLGVAESLGEVGDTLHLTFTLEVAGKQETLALLGDIRSQHPREPANGGAVGFSYGLQFRGLNRFQQLLLHSWVLERVVAEDLPSQVGG